MPNPNHLSQLNRRQALLVVGAGAAALLRRSADAATGVCVNASPTATEGPYWVDEMLNRSDIRIDPTDGTARPGVPLTLSIAVQELGSGGCAPLAGAHVDLWQCDAAGTYSDEAANNTRGRKYLRGYQTTDDNGQVQFTTIYPGWYSGRTIHIHVRIRTYSNGQVYDEFTSQLFFDESVTDTVMAQPPYSQRGPRDTRNATDMVLRGMANSSSMFVSLTPAGQGYAGSAAIGVTLKTVPAATPAVAAGGVVNAASYRDGVAPGSWAAIFGQNLATTTRTLASTDIVDGKLPTSLGGVSVSIGGQAAFLYYVSPSQIVFQAPGFAGAGQVQVTVANAGGNSTPASAAMQPIAPAFFTTNNYVAAVPAGGNILQLYATGFGPTSPAVAPGAVFNGSAATTNPVSVTIGGSPAEVLYAGLVGAGLYQINVAVPTLPAGDQQVVAQVGGLATPAALLKV